MKPLLLVIMELHFQVSSPFFKHEAMTTTSVISAILLWDIAEASGDQLSEPA